MRGFTQPLTPAAESLAEPVSSAGMPFGSPPICTFQKEFGIASVSIPPLALSYSVRVQAALEGSGMLAASISLTLRALALGPFQPPTRQLRAF